MHTTDISADSWLEREQVNIDVINDYKKNLISGNI